MPPSLQPLPIDVVVPAALASLEAHPNLVLQAPPGSGKTTRLPPALLSWLAARPRTQTGPEGNAPVAQRVLVLEPRRLAARAAARRIAEERGWSIGREVGWEVRFERRASATTPLVFLTEGLLRRKLADDPFLEGVGAVIFDEIHERSLDADLALALSRRVQREVRPDLLLVAMSATLDPAPLQQCLGDCPVLASDGALHPVSIRHLDEGAEAWAHVATVRGDTGRSQPAGRGGPPATDPGPAGLIDRVTWGVREVLANTVGDVLVFLPGVGEIERVRQRLVAVGDNLLVQPLYGDLAAADQDAVLALPPPGSDGTRPRRVVLATNVAETSVTVAGVSAVVDGGYARELRQDAATGLDHLELVRISRAAADQRAGRAGRSGPGVALRLWSRLDHLTLTATTIPEISRVDLAGACLELFAWGEDPRRFPWFERPRDERLQAAEELLHRLGALTIGTARPPQNATAKISDLGRRLARFPVPPRLARLLCATADAGHPELGALAAAILAERPAATRSQRGTTSSQSDLFDLCEGLGGTQRNGAAHNRHGHSLLRARDQLSSLLGREKSDGEKNPRFSAGGSRHAAKTDPPRPHLTGTSTAPVSAADALARAVFAAWPDRLCRRRASGSPRAVMIGGQGVVLAESSAVRDAELFVAIDLDAGRAGARFVRDGVVSVGEALVRLASAVEVEWIPEDWLVESIETHYDADRDRVLGRRVTRVSSPQLASVDPAARQSPADLVIAERPVPLAADTAAAGLLAVATDNLVGALPLDDPDFCGLLARLRFLANAMPELDLPQVDLACLRQLLPALVVGRRSFGELRRAPWSSSLTGLLDHRRQQALERHAPERLAVPSGSTVRIDYPPVDLAAEIAAAAGPPAGEMPPQSRSQPDQSQPARSPTIQSQPVQSQPILAVRIQELFGLAETPRLAAGRVAVLLHLLAPNGRPQQVTSDLRNFWDTTYNTVRKELAGRYPKHAWPTDPWNATPQRRPGRGRN